MSEGGKHGQRIVATFLLGRDEYGIEMAELREVVDAPEAVQVMPLAPAYLKGLFHLGGAAEGAAPKILVFQHAGSRVAMRVDHVETILQVSLGGEQDLPELFFREEKGRFEEGYEKGIETRGKEGEKQAVVILRAEQIVERLAGALAA